MTEERKRIIELLDELINLKKELLGTVQLRADTARMDWLEKAGGRLECRRGLGISIQPWVIDLGRYEYDAITASSARAGIDAAMIEFPNA